MEKKEPIYRCKICGWEGTYSELDFDKVDTCAGDDRIEICPACGLAEVYIVNE